ncbi:MAG: glutamine--fructose-6-phosphate transaminase (isomerizing) [Candidatus Lambdaproteobacteria bacterium]|nr:glutamine--fructose-6-phosphate transaminase (isomerizing) [Candidatus Lambdaproteobacteria bacterium]
MCGISAVTGREDIVHTLFESIKNLEYRGYDSCGFGIVQDGTVEVRKNTGGVDEVNGKEHLTSMLGCTGIAHTRWATHGKVDKINAHPHQSGDGRFSIVHNGIINNYQDLKSELMEQGVTFLSETDTEVAAHLIGLAYSEFGDVRSALLAALKRLEGSYALLMVTPLEPDTIYAVKHGSPLVLGLAAGRNFVASDVNAFLPFTHEAAILEDGEFAVVQPDRWAIYKIDSQAPVARKPFRIEWDPETSRKGGYPHYMLKEIFDQPQTIRNALATPLPEIVALAESIRRAHTTYLMGVGTTHYVAQVAQYYFSQLAGRFLPAVSSDEFNDLAVIGADDLLISISQSGETFDTRRGVKFAQEQGARTASIVNVMGSSLTTMVDQVIMQGSGPEICVVSTKAALAQMIILLRTALELARIEKRLEPGVYNAHLKSLGALPAVVQQALNEQSGFVRNLATRTIHFQNWLFLGRSVYYPIALEAALKMKEVTYLHVEGIPAGFLKHGTLALVDEHMLSMFFVPPTSIGELHALTLTAIEEVKARGGPVAGIIFEGDAKAEHLLDHRIVLPQVDALVAPFMELVVAQLFSYFSALQLGRSIDKPRNLAKSVTVG